jgi:hypothetical protein
VEGHQGGIWAQWSKEISYVLSTSQTYSSLVNKVRKVISSSDRY